ncbi:hypothetical protein GCM10010431_55990 [Streptomyces kunmingensis]
MRIPAEAHPDFIEKVARRTDPLGAVEELAWNGLDADVLLIMGAVHRSARLSSCRRMTVSRRGSMSSSPTSRIRSRASDAEELVNRMLRRTAGSTGWAVVKARRSR